MGPRLGCPTPRTLQGPRLNRHPRNGRTRSPTRMGDRRRSIARGRHSSSYTRRSLRLRTPWRSARQTCPTSRRPVDQDLLPWLNLPLVAKPLQCGERRHRDGRRLLQRQVGRFRRDCVANAHVLGEGSVPRAEYLVTRSKLCDVSADRFLRPREVDSQSVALWFGYPGEHVYYVRPAGQGEESLIDQPRISAPMPLRTNL